MIRADRLSKTFGGGFALSDVTFDVSHGEAVHVAGPAGSGRTTLLRILAAVVPPSSGRASIDGMDVVTQAFLVRRAVFLVGASAGRLHDATVSEYLQLIRTTRGVAHRTPPAPRVHALMERGCLRPDAAVDTLTVGERRRLELAAAVAAGARVMLLDDPFAGAGADTASIDALIADARMSGATILAATATGALAPGFCDRTIVLDGGRLVTRAPCEAVGA